MLRPAGHIPDSSVFLGSNYMSATEATRLDHNALTNTESLLMLGACVVSLYNFGEAAALVFADAEPSQSSLHIFAGLLNAIAAGGAALRSSCDTHF